MSKRDLGPHPGVPVSASSGWDLALAACVGVAFLRELVPGTWHCDRCDQELPYVFGQTHVWWPWRSPTKGPHDAPCGLPCIHPGAMTYGFIHGIHNGPTICPRCTGGES